MATQLETNLQDILTEKTTKIIPENIKKDVTVFDITGTLETGSTINNQDKTVTENGIYQADEGYTGLGQITVNVPGSGEVPVKLFNTVEEMNADPNPQEGDLALVYGNDLANWDGSSEIAQLTFPKIVVLTEAATGSYNGESGWMNTIRGTVSANSASFRFNIRGTMPITLTVSYTSIDGLTYTRTDTNEETIIFNDTPMKFSGTLPDVCAQFMKIGLHTFGGLYKYGPYTNNNKFATYTNLAYDSGYKYESEGYISIDDLARMKSLLNEYDSTIANVLIVKTRENPNILTAYAYSYIYKGEPATTKYLASIMCFESKLYAGWRMTTGGDYTDPVIYKYTLNLDTNDFTHESANALQYGSYTSGSNTFTLTYAFKELPSNAYFTAMIVTSSNPEPKLRNIDMYRLEGYKVLASTYYTDMVYNVAPTQLTLTNPNQLLPDIIAYGQNGITIGDGGITQPDNTFADTPAELYSKIQQNYDSMEPRILTDTDKTIDKNIYCIPTKSDGTILLDISNIMNMQNLFQNCINLTTIPEYDTSNVTNMGWMFDGCKQLKTIPLLNTSNVTKMSAMFQNCSNLVSIPLINTSKVVGMGNMFAGCNSLVSIPLLDTSSVTDMSFMFNNCTSLISIPQLDTSKVTDIGRMFQNCTSLISMPQLDLSNVTSLVNIFYNCTSLENIPQLDTSNITSMYGMFQNCTSLISIPQLNTSNVTDMYSMFKGCTNLTVIPLLATSKVTDMDMIFQGNTNLTDVPQLDTSKVMHMYNMFLNCSKLTNESLNNILAMCKNAVNYTGTKTLKYIGLSQEQATKCTTLSNYSAFATAGWTTGY